MIRNRMMHEKGELWFLGSVNTLHRSCHEDAPALPDERPESPLARGNKLPVEAAGDSEGGRFSSAALPKRECGWRRSGCALGLDGDELHFAHAGFEAGCEEYLKLSNLP